MTPLEHYQLDLESPDFNHDASQALAVARLDELYHRLVAKEQAKTGFWFGLASYFRQWFYPNKPINPQKGLYFWGGVGRGKTYLMDMFYETLPFENKLRMHFHRFMRRVHHELAEAQGQKNPLNSVAKRIASEACVICFDEFFVLDIADAMLLAGLFEALFTEGVCLVTTSNIEPNKLYKNGLQRARFLPAIALVERHTEALNIDGGVDYRLRTLEQERLYYTPIEAATEAAMLHCFHMLAPLDERDFVCIESNVSIEIEGREIIARHLADDVVWFDFFALCDGPRSQHDYIELAKEFHAVLVSNVPQLGSHNEDLARRFISMVDEFYDHRIKLVLSVDVALSDLYTQGRLSFEFERTRSRLQEMQSHDYLATAHRA